VKTRQSTRKQRKGGTAAAETHKGGSIQVPPHPTALDWADQLTVNETQRCSTNETSLTRGPFHPQSCTHTKKETRRKKKEELVGNKNTRKRRLGKKHAHSQRYSCHLVFDHSEPCFMVLTVGCTACCSRKRHPVNTAATEARASQEKKSGTLLSMRNSERPRESERDIFFETSPALWGYAS
jgi:hypothetical protein